MARTLTRNHAGQVVLGDRPKSDNGNRLIPLAPQVVATLREHRIRQLERRMALADVWEDQDLVFPGPVGNICTGAVPRARLAALCERAGVSCVGLHGLRRTVGSVLLAEGESLRATADLLGHGGMDVTFRRYVKASDQQRKGAAATLARAVIGAD